MNQIPERTLFERYLLKAEPRILDEIIYDPEKEEYFAIRSELIHQAQCVQASWFGWSAHKKHIEGDDITNVIDKSKMFSRVQTQTLVGLLKQAKENPTEEIKQRIQDMLTIPPQPTEDRTDV